MAGTDNVQRRRSLDSMSSQSELDYETCDSGLSSERSSNGGRESNGGLSDGNASDTNDAGQSNMAPSAAGRNSAQTLTVESNANADLVRSVSSDSIKTAPVATATQNTSNHLIRSASSESVKTRRQTSPGLNKTKANLVRTVHLGLFHPSEIASS